MLTIELKLLVLAAFCTLASSIAVLRRSDLGTANRNTLDNPQDFPGLHVHTNTNGLDNHNANNAQEGNDRLFEHLIKIRNSDDTTMQVGTGGAVYHTHSERPDSNQQYHGLLADTIQLFSTRQEMKGVPEAHSDLDLTPQTNDADSNKL